MLSGREMFYLTELNKNGFGISLFKRKYKNRLKAAYKRLKSERDCGKLETEAFEIYNQMLQKHIL